MTEQQEIAAADHPLDCRVRRDSQAEFAKLADALAPLMTEPYSPDCATCANRGKAHGLSQETYCEHCIWHQAWRQDHYVPNT